MKTVSMSKADDFNADLDRSWVVGDSTADVALANSAGVRSILDLFPIKC